MSSLEQLNEFARQLSHIWDRVMQCVALISRVWSLENAVIWQIMTT